MMLPVWLIGMRGLWKTCFLPLHDSIQTLWKVNGSLWLTQYLAECSRIIVMWVNGEPYVHPTDGVRVRVTRAGLPVILPTELRKIFHLLRGQDHAYALLAIRVTLSVLAVYRVIGCSPNMKLGTITDPFSGTEASLPFWEIRKVIGMMPAIKVVGERIWTYMSESAGPNFKKSTWSCGLDALAFLRFPLTWYHWLVIAFHQKRWLEMSWMLLVIGMTLPLAPLLIWIGKYPRFLGRLVPLFEARGKVRIVAITDWWTQILLKPLHSAIFKILRTIPQDGTFDQMAPVHRLIAYVRASGTKVFSFDLSAATDRLPLKFQMDVLRSFGIEWADHWGSLLVGRPWFLKGEGYKYSVGQPMGALSSWAMLALSHHIIVQIAARRSGYLGWFPHYALLGDDIIIADEGVAKNYLDLIATLGVPINMTKSFIMASGGLEFAKRWISPTLGDISPMSAGLVLACLRNPRILATLLRDCMNRGFVFSTRICSDLVRVLSFLRPRKWIERWKGPILSSVLGPTGGLWKTASGPYFKAVWIKLFPHPLASKYYELIDILYQLRVASQVPPLSEEESKAELVSNLWKHVQLLGTDFRGLIWMPLIIISPSFWVYYDLTATANRRLYEFIENKHLYDDLFDDRGWLMLDGLMPSVWGLALDNWLKSTFDPGLLEWDRKVAEEDLQMHKQLFVRWGVRSDQLLSARKIRELFPDYDPNPAPAMEPRPFVNPVPFHKSLVPLGYWGKCDPQRITLRTQEIPSTGRQTGC